MHFLFPIADFVDLEEEVLPHVDADDGEEPLHQDDGEGLSQDQEEGTDGAGPALVQNHDAGIPPPHAIGMMKAMELAGGDSYIQAALDADKRLRTESAPLNVYSERTGGAARKERLKRKASDITRSACETFAYCTSRTTSIEDTAMLLSAFTNVSDIFKYIQSIT